MPTYEYACKACGEHLEVVQSFKDDALTQCPSCGGALRKVFGNIGVAFKGSGFYKTDSRSDGRKGASKLAEPKSAEAAGDSSPKAVEPSSGPKQDGAGSKPAPPAKDGAGKTSTPSSSAPAASAAS